LPLGVLEIMAASKPVVASDVHGIPEMVKNNLNGFLVPSKNPELLADKIMDLLSNPALAKQMGVEGRKMIEKHFEINIIASKWLELYKSMI
jgi:glycosyltransferase involved in cell wall biosynthesis